MPALINQVIGATPDNVELIRDQIAAILKIELTNQQVLTSKPQPRVFVERDNPWGQFAEDGDTKQPIIHVGFDSESFDGAASNAVERQKVEAIYQIDCYGYGVSADDASGHKPGDQTAALECQRALRLVRNILMSAPYTYLGLRKTVWRRWPQTLTMFRPEMGDRPAFHVVAGRFSLGVHFNELSPQVTGEPLETLSVEVIRAGTGEVYLRADYPQPEE